MGAALILVDNIDMVMHKYGLFSYKKQKVREPAMLRVLAGSLFFRNWSALKPGERYKSWDKKFQNLKSYPNVLVTPHSAFLTEQALCNIAATTVENIREFSTGRKLTNQVSAKK